MELKMEVKLDGLEPVEVLLGKAQEQLSEVRKTIREIYDAMNDLTVKIGQPSAGTND